MAIDHIKDLRPDPENARKHNPRNIGLITDALQDVGAARSIVIDEDDTILAGNGTVEAAADAGITKVHVVEADGDTIIAVRRRNLTPEQKRRLALFDNKSSDLAEWDTDVLKALQDDGVDLGVVGFSDDELADLLPEAADPEAVQRMSVERPRDVVWVLVGIPIAEWPQHHEAIEALKTAATVSSVSISIAKPAHRNDVEVQD